MRKSFLASIISAAFATVAFAGIASAETFSVNGGTISATKSGDNVTITATGIPAVTLVHYQHQGIKPVAMNNGVGVLQNVSENGARFQIRDASGKYLLITPSGNGFKMAGVMQECRKSRDGCALEAIISKS